MKAYNVENTTSGGFYFKKHIPIVIRRTLRTIPARQALVLGLGTGNKVFERTINTTFKCCICIFYCSFFNRFHLLLWV